MHYWSFFFSTPIISEEWFRWLCHMLWDVHLFTEPVSEELSTAFHHSRPSHELDWASPALPFPEMESCVPHTSFLHLFSFFLTVDMATACKLQVSVLARVMVEMGSCTQQEKITTSPNKIDFKKNKNHKPTHGIWRFASFALQAVAGFMSKRVKDWKRQCRIQKPLPHKEHLRTISTHLIA